MREGEVTSLWIPTGKIVTRWKEDTPSLSSAIIAKTVEELRETLTAKFGRAPKALSSIGIFQFKGWADDGREVIDDAARGVCPEPLVSFAKLLTAAQITERLMEIAAMLEKQQPQEWYTEVFIRSRQPVDDVHPRRFRKGGRQ